MLRDSRTACVWRQLAATLGRIYPYRAAKQQAPGVAANDVKGFPNRSGMTGDSRSGRE